MSGTQQSGSTTTPLKIGVVIVVLCVALAVVLLLAGCTR